MLYIYMQASIVRTAADSGDFCVPNRSVSVDSVM